MTGIETEGGSDERAEVPAWRVVWTEKTATGRWLRHERLEYAETQSRAANQALAKIRQASPGGCIVSCNAYLPLGLNPSLTAGPRE